MKFYPILQFTRPIVKLTSETFHASLKNVNININVKARFGFVTKIIWLTSSVTKRARIHDGERRWIISLSPVENSQRKPPVKFHNPPPAPSTSKSNHPLHLPPSQNSANSIPFTSTVPKTTLTNSEQRHQRHWNRPNHSMAGYTKISNLLVAMFVCQKSSWIVFFGRFYSFSLKNF